MSYEEDVRIDENSLDEELMRQPQLVVQYGNIAAEKRSEKERLRELVSLVRAEAKQQLEKERALVELTIRRSGPEQYGVEKLTEAVVQALVNEQDRYHDALEEYSDAIKTAIYDYSEAVKQHTAYKSAMEAFRDRRYALESLIKLQLSGFYGEVRVSGGDATERREFTREAVRKTIKKDKRKTIKRRTSKNAKK
ncbi:MAG: hypothetical protein DRJ03_01035 [Chloroflexi bacterium]|nr:MAG: hypothetical protein DRJ03_01035 [Chloroflexota bacterium]RLI67383.1 MAG: hypothetical protein DRP02_14545 [Candidatus Gerdarchaeota archaeon]